MKVWLCRNKAGVLTLHDKRPLLIEIIDMWHNGYRGEILPDIFPEVTFENSPQEVELKLIEK